MDNGGSGGGASSLDKAADADDGGDKAVIVIDDDAGEPNEADGSYDVVDLTLDEDEKVDDSIDAACSDVAVAGRKRGRGCDATPQPPTPQKAQPAPCSKAMNDGGGGGGGASYLDDSTHAPAGRDAAAVIVFDDGGEPNAAVAFSDDVVDLTLDDVDEDEKVDDSIDAACSDVAVAGRKRGRGCDGSSGRGSGEESRNPSGGGQGQVLPFAPFRLLRTAMCSDDNGPVTGAAAASSAATTTEAFVRRGVPPLSRYRSTLRQIMGFDEENSGHPDGGGSLPRIRWMVISNFMIDFEYLLDEIPELPFVERVVVFYGDDCGSSTEMWAVAASAAGSSVDFVRLVPSDPKRSKFNPLPAKVDFSCHHTKLFLIGCDDGIRVVVHTSNLIEHDVLYSTQAAYVQDFPARIPDDGTSSSSFEDALVGYVDSYGYAEKCTWPGAEVVEAAEAKSPRTGMERTLSQQLRRYDYSGAYGALIPSIPGWHPTDRDLGYLALRRLVNRHNASTAVRRPGAAATPFATAEAEGEGAIVCQFSSIGSLSEKWLEEFASAADARAATTGDRDGGGSAAKSRREEAQSRRASARKLHFVWPTVDDVRDSIRGYRGGNSVPGRMKNLEKECVSSRLCRWIPLAETSSSYGGGKKHGEGAGAGARMALPHMKSYLQLRNDGGVEWIVVSSHNLSKAAWGEVQQSRHRPEHQLFIRNWELGVFFSPSLLASACEGTLFSLSSPSLAVRSYDERGRECLRGMNVTKKSSNCSTIVALKPLEFIEEDTADSDIGRNGNEGASIVALPLPFCVPPRLYSKSDVPWAVDRVNCIPDHFGRLNGYN